MEREIINSINEDYCSFEVSKLLKDKGFDCEIDPPRYFIIKPKTKGVHGRLKVGEEHLHMGSMVDELHFKDNNYALKPSHSLAIKWIRENFGIHISIFPSSLTNNEVGDLKGCDTFYARLDNRWNLAHSNDGKNIPYRDYVAYTKYNSWEEAESAALLYTLQNLIP